MKQNAEGNDESDQELMVASCLKRTLHERLNTKSKRHDAKKEHKFEKQIAKLQVEKQIAKH